MTDVRIRITVEATPCEDEIVFTRDEWDGMTPRQRQTAINEAVEVAIANAGGAGYHILSGATDADLAEEGR